MIEFVQPTNPMRIVTGNAEVAFRIPVFAIGLEDHHVEYLTINGDFYTADRIKYAEMNINGEWTRLDVIRLSSQQAKPESPSTD